MKLNKSFTFTDLLANSYDLENLLKFATPTIIELLNTAGFIKTKSTRQIKLLNWPKNKRYISFRKDSCTISLEEVKQEIKDQTEKDEITVMRKVTVKMLDLIFIMSKQ